MHVLFTMCVYDSYNILVDMCGDVLLSYSNYLVLELIAITYSSFYLLSFKYLFPKWNSKKRLIFSVSTNLDLKNSKNSLSTSIK